MGFFVEGVELCRDVGLWVDVEWGGGGFGNRGGGGGGGPVVVVGV